MRLTSQKRLDALIKVNKHEFLKAIKEHVEWRKKHSPGLTTRQLVCWYKHFTKYLYNLDQREIMLNNNGFGRKYIQFLLDEGKSNINVRQYYRNFQATINRIDILHNLKTKELFRDFAKMDKANEDYFMTNEEVKQLLKFKTDNNTERIILDRFLVCCFTGCRRSECLSVVVVNDTTLKYTSTKTKKDIIVPFNDPIKHLFVDESFKEYVPYWTYNPNEILHAIFKRLGWKGFVTKYRIHGKVKSSYKVPRSESITFHSARKFYGKMLLDMDVSIFKVSQLLGHHMVSTTQNYYAAITKEKMINEVIEKMNKF